MAELLGSITLTKRLRRHPIWERMDYGYAWVDLLLLANDQDRRAGANGTMYDLKRGQLLWSKRSLEKEWKKSGEWLDKFLQVCQDESMITVDADKRRTIITILNYDAYNPPKPVTETESETGTEPVTETESETGTEPVTDTESETGTEPVTDTERNGERGNEKGKVERARAEKTANNFDVVPSGKNQKSGSATGQFPDVSGQNKKNAAAGRTPAQARFELGRELEAVSARLDAAAELGVQPDAADMKREKELKAALAAIGRDGA